MKEITLKVDVDCSSIDAAIEKAKQLEAILKEIKQIAVPEIRGITIII